MAKKKRKQGFSDLLIYLAVLFTIVLFIVKLVAGGLGWLDVFAPLLIVFFIFFLLNVLKTVIKKI